MKTSYNRLVQFSATARRYLATHKEETKLSWAIGRVLAQLGAKTDQAMQSKLMDIDIDFALTDPPDDPNGRILKDANGNLEFSKTGLKQRNAAHAALREKEDIDISPYFTTAVPDNLTDLELEAFSGLVLGPEQVLDILKAREAAAANAEPPHGALAASAGSPG